MHGGTTVLLPNESFAYAYFDYQRDFEKFVDDMKAVDELRASSGALKPTMRDDVIYHTTLPWISFMVYMPAPRVVIYSQTCFGKFAPENERLMMPISVEVHHALMDGLHVGRFFSQLEEALADPLTFVKK